MRVTRDSDLAAAIELCVDDQWLTISDPLQFSTDQFLPGNLQLSSFLSGLSAEWEVPLLESGKVVTGYDITCTQVQPGNLQHSSESLTVDGTTTSALVTITALQPTDYRCCITSHIQRDVLTIFSLGVCDTAQFTPPPVSVPTGNFILVPVLGVLVGVFFLALVIVGVALVVFMTASTSKVKRLEDRENLEEEMKE